MSEETKKEIYKFLEENYIQGNWETIVDYIDEHFISKKEIGRTMDE